METFGVKTIENADGDNQAAAQQMLGDIYFKPVDLGSEFHDHCRRDDRTGLVIYNPDNDTLKAVVFRGVSLGTEWGGIVPPTVDTLPEQRQTLKDNAKGVGLYTASSPGGVEVFAREIGREIGVFLTPDVRELQFRDRRDGNPNSPITAVRGILRHRAYMRRAKQEDAKRPGEGEMAVVRDIDGEHEDADVVLMNPAPTVYAKHLWRIRNFPQYAPVWALVRRGVQLERIGTARSFDY